MNEIKPISFCVATANNEKEYIKLLIRSIVENTVAFHLHEILVFVDTDNQNTYEELLTIKKSVPQLRIHRNTRQFPIWSQRNSSIMFHHAKNDIVCFLQSDMVLGPKFDEHVMSSLDENTILSCLRIEPPLHPAGPEKIIQDFGLTPESFKYQDFMDFARSIQSENRPDTVGYFAPFVIHKKTWFDNLGGFDTQFRCSREDSDLIIRIGMAGIKMMESWKACVYHFTCVSSRGKDWFDNNNEEAKKKNALQQLADQEELKKFIRKWGYFGHHHNPVYKVALHVKSDSRKDFVDPHVIMSPELEPFFHVIYLDDQRLVDYLNKRLDFQTNYYANIRWGYSYNDFNDMKDYLNLRSTLKIVPSWLMSAEDIIVSVEYKDLFDSMMSHTAQNLFSNIQSIVHDNEVGDYKYGPFMISIKKKEDVSQSYVRMDQSFENFDQFTFE